MIALITGISGQDGSYLAELLISKGYEVHGIVRKSSTINTGRLDGIYNNPKLFLHYGDMLDLQGLARRIISIRPDEIYHLAAQSHVHVSFQLPEYTMQVNTLPTVCILDTIKDHLRNCRFYQACSSEIFGNQPAPQSEQTVPAPVSPYAVAKLSNYHTVKHYRKAYGLWAVNGILFNHESKRRGETFVTRKITMAIADMILKGTAVYENMIRLGNVSSMRDWGYAPEYVEAIFEITQQDDPIDLVIATGRSHSVQDFLVEAFGLVDLDWVKRVVTNIPKYHRASDIAELRGDASLAEEMIGWNPKVGFKGIVRLMLEADLKRVGLDPAKHITRNPITVDTNSTTTVP